MAETRKQQQYGIYKYTLTVDCTIDGQDLTKGTVIYIGIDKYINYNQRHKDHMQPSDIAHQYVNTWLQTNKDKWIYGVVEVLKPPQQKTTQNWAKIEKRAGKLEANLIEQMQPILNRQEGGKNANRKGVSRYMKEIEELNAKIPNWQQVWRDFGVNELYIEMFEKLERGEITHIMNATGRDFGKSFLTSLMKIVNMLKDETKNYVTFRRQDAQLGGTINQRYASVSALARMYDAPFLMEQDTFHKFNPFGEWPKFKFNKDNKMNNQSEKYYSGEHFLGYENTEKFKGFSLPHPQYVEYIEMEEFNQEKKDSTITPKSQLMEIRSLSATGKRSARAQGKKLGWVWNGNAADPGHPIIKLILSLSDNKNFVDWALKDPLQNYLRITYHDNIAHEGVYFGNIAVVYGTSFFNPTIRNNKQEVYERYRELYEWSEELDEKFWSSEDAEFSKFIGENGIVNGDNENALYEIMGRVRSGVSGHQIYKTTFKDYKMKRLQDLLVYNDLVRATIGMDIDMNEEFVITIVYELRSKSGETTYAVAEQQVLGSRGSGSWVNENMINWAIGVYHDVLELLEVFGINEPPIFYIDDDKGMVAAAIFKEMSRRGGDQIHTAKAKKHTPYGIVARQYFINTAVPIEDVVFLEGNERLIEDFMNCVEGTTAGKRDEGKGRNKLNKINSAEYALWLAYRVLRVKRPGKYTGGGR